MNTQHLVRLGQAYATHHGLELSTVSTYAAADGKWLKRLHEGASCTLRKAAAVVWAALDQADALWIKHDQLVTELLECLHQAETAGDLAVCEAALG